MRKRSFWALGGSILVVVVGSTAVDAVLHLLHFYPPLKEPITDAQAAVATAYRLLISVWAAYLCAAWAPRRPMKHAVILGLIGTVMGSLAAAATWGQKLGPAWYPVALAVLAFPQSWAGGKLYCARHPSTVQE
jgi:hypothetical protein